MFLDLNFINSVLYEIHIDANSLGVFNKKSQSDSDLIKLLLNSSFMSKLMKRVTILLNFCSNISSFWY